MLMYFYVVASPRQFILHIINIVSDVTTYDYFLFWQHSSFISRWCGVRCSDVSVSYADTRHT